MAFVACFAAGSASAQTTAQLPVQFDFLAPGARSLALGGAFIAAADDATAAFTNPAGLAFIGRFELSFEGRFRRVDTPYLAAGRISGSITGRGADSIPTAVYRQDTDRRVGPTFASFIFPVGAKTTVTAYRHEVAAVDNSFFYEGVFLASTGGLSRDSPVDGSRHVRIANYGGSIGYQVIDDKLAVGGGVSLYTFTLGASFARHGFETDLTSPIDLHLVSATATQTAGDKSVGVNTGALWWPRPDWRFGVTYRRGPRFAFTQDDRLLAIGKEVTRSGRFKVPDVFGFGSSWRAVNNDDGVLRILVDYGRVQYAQLKEDFIDFQAIASGRQDQLRIDSANEVHGGAEYRMLRFRKKPLARELAFRAGAWFDPDHTVRYVPKAVPDDLDTLLAATLPGGSNVVHYSFGAGVNWNKRLSVNAAADLSSRAKYATISAEVIFPRKVKPAP